MTAEHEAPQPLAAVLVEVLIGLEVFFYWFLSFVTSAGAGIYPGPRPDLGKTFLVHACAFGGRRSPCHTGYVYPGLGHLYLWFEPLNIALVGVIAAMTIPIAVMRLWRRRFPLPEEMTAGPGYPFARVWFGPPASNAGLVRSAEGWALFVSWLCALALIAAAFQSLAPGSYEDRLALWAAVWCTVFAGLAVAAHWQR